MSVVVVDVGCVLGLVCGYDGLMKIEWECC